MDFLNSRQLSAFCFIVNTAFFVWMLTSGEYCLSVLPLIAGIICLSNVIQWLKIDKNIIIIKQQ